MTCEDVRPWLLEGGSAEELSPEQHDHVQTCAGCRELAGRIVHLDAAWRALPLPAACAAAKTAFLRGLPPRPAESARPRKRFPLPWILAASLLLAVGLAGLLRLPGPPGPAGPGPP